MINKQDVGFRVAEKRKRLGMSQSQLGELLDISHAAISDIERGKTNLNVEEISKIALVLKTTFEELTYSPNFDSSIQSFHPNSAYGVSNFRLGKNASPDSINKAEQTIKERLEELRKKKNDSQ